MIAGSNPFSDGPACLLKTANGQIDQLCRSIISGKATARFGGFSERAIFRHWSENNGEPVQAFNRICRVDDFAHCWWEGEERDDFLPRASPAWSD